jgi:hypothetical protein
VRGVARGLDIILDEEEDNLDAELTENDNRYQKGSNYGEISPEVYNPKNDFSLR